MSYCNRVSEVLYPLVFEHADSQAAGTHYSQYANLKDYHRAWFVIDVGNMVAGATLAAGIQQATNTSGGSVKAITDKTITQLTQAGGDAESLVCIELQTEELDVDGGFDCVRFYVTVANANVEYSAILYGVEPRFAPVPTTNWQEIVT